MNATTMKQFSDQKVKKPTKQIDELLKLNVTMEAVLQELQSMRSTQYSATTKMCKSKAGIPTRYAETMSKEVMKNHCKARGLKVSGSKVELAERLMAHDVKAGQREPAIKKICVEDGGDSVKKPEKRKSV